MLDVETPTFSFTVQYCAATVNKSVALKLAPTVQRLELTKPTTASLLSTLLAPAWSLNPPKSYEPEIMVQVTLLLARSSSFCRLRDTAIGPCKKRTLPPMLLPKPPSPAATCTAKSMGPSRGLS